MTQLIEKSVGCVLCLYIFGCVNSLLKVSEIVCFFQNWIPNVYLEG
jgi:hypothetical protein